MSPTLFDPWLLDDGESAVEAKFRPSLVARAKKRTVTFVPFDGNWSVSGHANLGDSRSSYDVEYVPATRKYRCTCHSSDHGEVRAKNMCSHVLAVVLYRTKHRPPARAIDTDTHTVNTLPPAEDPTVGREVSSPPRGDIPLPNDPIFGRPPVPAQFSSIRDHQWDAINEIVDALRTTDLVFVDAPTGAGKTLIAELTRRLTTPKALYVCSSIQLQAQFLNDFAYAREIKGRSNYEPANGFDGATCADCTAAPPANPDCLWCPDLEVCPYRIAKSSAAGAELAVLNTSYFMHAANYAGEFSGRDLVIVDEADTLEGNLMGFIEVTIGKKLMTDLDLGQPKHVTKPEAWQEWLERTVLPALEKERDRLPAHSSDIETIRRRKTLTELIAKLDKVADGVTDGNWVFDDYQQGKATFRPIRVDEFGKDALWRHGKKWILMSATIISPDEMAESLGWEKDFSVVKVPAVFPVENRRVHVLPVASMTAKGRDTEWPKMATAIANLADRHADERMLVHTVSYQLMEHIADYLKKQGFGNRVVTYRYAGERDRVLAKFKKTKGGILLAPSMDRGVDLPHDDCRVVVVAKVPFPYLGDKQVNARLYSKGGQQWYSVAAIRSLVQMTGRGVRSATDTCTTYVLDSQFVSQVWSKNRSLLPKWWAESLVWDSPKREIVAARSV